MSELGALGCAGCRLAIVLTVASGIAYAQLASSGGLGGGLGLPRAQARTAVAYLFPEQVSVAAGKPAAVTLHFKVAAGLHINSHTPREPELIPTTLSVPEASGVKLAGATFPRGVDFAFSGSGAAAEKLSVYTGDFAVTAELVAAPGEHLMEGALRYQACDDHICLPPTSIPVAIDVIAK